MDIAVRKLDPFIVMQLDGPFRDDDSAKFQTEVSRRIQQGAKDFLIHFHQVGSLSSQGLGTLVSVWKKVVEAKGSLYVVAEQSRLRSVFESTNLHTIIEIFPSEEEFRNKIIAADRHEPTPRLRSRGKYQVIDVASSYGVMVEANSLDAPLRKLVEAGKNHIAVNLTDVIHLNSSALGLLIKWSRILKEKGGELCLSGLSKDLLYYVELIRLNQAVVIYETEDEIPPL